MPRLLTHRHRQIEITGMLPASDRNGVRLLIGMAPGFTSESAADQLPDDLASAHAMILAERTTLTPHCLMLIC